MTEDRRRCSACDAALDPGDAFCRACGHRREAPAPQIAGGREIRKLPVPEGYPPEEGSFLRGNDFSPVAVAVILSSLREETPPSIEALVTAAIEAGAALAGTLQTENIGIEKMLCNLTANANIRHLVIAGPESPGHSTGNALLCLSRSGLDEKKRIIGAKAFTPYLYNVPSEMIERFRRQYTLVDLINEGDPALVKRAVHACIQEEPTDFRGLKLWDPGAFEEEPLCAKIAWKVKEPWYAPRSDDEMKAKQRVDDIIAKLRRRQEEIK